MSMNEGERPRLKSTDGIVIELGMDAQAYLEEAEAFVDDLSLDEALGLEDDHDLDLFEACLALRNIALEEGNYDTFINHPNIQATKRVPLLSRYVKRYERDHAEIAVGLKELTEYKQTLEDLYREEVSGYEFARNLELSVHDLISRSTITKLKGRVVELVGIEITAEIIEPWGNIWRSRLLPYLPSHICEPAPNSSFKYSNFAPPDRRC